MLSGSIYQTKTLLPVLISLVVDEGHKCHFVAY